MRQYLDSNSIANTVRMTASVRGTHAALVERDADVTFISVLAEKYGYFVAPAYSCDILLGAVQTLEKDGWSFACTNVSGVPAAPHRCLASLRDFPWLADPWTSGFTHNGGKMCLIVLAVDAPPENANAPLEPAVEGVKAAHALGQTSWQAQNRRRVALIRQQTQRALQPNEQSELTLLQSEASRRVNKAFPLPFDMLDELERYVEQAEKRLLEHDNQ